MNGVDFARVNVRFDCARLKPPQTFNQPNGYPLCHTWVDDGKSYYMKFKCAGQNVTVGSGGLGCGVVSGENSVANSPYAANHNYSSSKRIEFNAATGGVVLQRWFFNLQAREVCSEGSFGASKLSDDTDADPDVVAYTDFTASSFFAKCTECTSIGGDDADVGVFAMTNCEYEANDPSKKRGLLFSRDVCFDSEMNGFAYFVDEYCKEPASYDTIIGVGWRGECSGLPMDGFKLACGEDLVEIFGDCDATCKECGVTPLLSISGRDLKDSCVRLSSGAVTYYVAVSAHCEGAKSIRATRFGRNCETVMRVWVWIVVIGGALLLIIAAVIVGIVCYRKRRMQKESQPSTASTFVGEPTMSLYHGGVSSARTSRTLVSSARTSRTLRESAYRNHSRSNLRHTVHSYSGTSGAQNDGSAIELHSTIVGHRSRSGSRAGATRL